MAHAIVQSGDNTKANEFLFRRLTVEDAAEAHVVALAEGAGAWLRHLHHLGHDAVLARRLPCADRRRTKRWWRATSRIFGRSTRNAVGPCLPRSTASTMRARRRENSASSAAPASRRSSTACDREPIAFAMFRTIEVRSAALDYRPPPEPSSIRQAFDVSHSTWRVLDPHFLLVWSGVPFDDVGRHQINRYETAKLTRPTHPDIMVILRNRMLQSFPGKFFKKQLIDLIQAGCSPLMEAGKCVCHIAIGMVPRGTSGVGCRRVTTRPFAANCDSKTCRRLRTHERRASPRLRRFTRLIVVHQLAAYQTAASSVSTRSEFGTCCAAGGSAGHTLHACIASLCSACDLAADRLQASCRFWRLRQLLSSDDARTEDKELYLSIAMQPL